MIPLCVGNIILFIKLSHDIMNQILEKRYESTKHLIICISMLFVFITDLCFFFYLLLVYANL